MQVKELQPASFFAMKFKRYVAEHNVWRRWRSCIAPVLETQVQTKTMMANAPAY
jgi:hypothetical protein